MFKVNLRKLKRNTKKLRLLVLITAIFGVILVSIFFVSNLNKYSKTEDTEASGTCTVSGGKQNAAGCGSNGGCCDYSGNQNFIGLGSAGCGAENCVYLDTRNGANTCGYTHYDVCIQKSVALSGRTGGLQCTRACYWGCCSFKEGVRPVKYLELPGGVIKSYNDHYKGEGIDGRVDEANCSLIRGWAGTKNDFLKPSDIFFSIGKPYFQGGVIFNPQIKADKPDPNGNGSLICDFLDNKPDGIFPECEKCYGTACDHVYNIDLSNFKDSPIFNGEATVDVYAYSSYGGIVGNLNDGETATTNKFTLSNCGSGWDGKSDELPASAKAGSGGGDADPTPVEQPLNYDLNLDGELNLQDFSYFSVGYKKCNSSSTSQDSSDCKDYKSGGFESNLDFDDDGLINIKDFISFANAYKVCNKPGDSGAQDSTECKELKGQG